MSETTVGPSPVQAVTCLNTSSDTFPVRMPEVDFDVSSELVGLVAGTCSTVFVAAPVAALMARQRSRG